MEANLAGETIVTVLTTLTARPGKETELRDLLRSLLEPTRKEAGCLGYDLHVALDNPAKFLFLGNWQSQAQLDAHFQTAPVMLALRRMDELCTEPVNLAFWRPIG